MIKYQVIEFRLMIYKRLFKIIKDDKIEEFVAISKEQTNSGRKY